MGLRLTSFADVTLVNRKAWNITRATALGNPFLIEKDGTQKGIYLKYKEYLFNLVESSKDTPVTEEFLKLEKRYIQSPDIDLFCWCESMWCHGRAIAELLRKRNPLKEGLNPAPLFTRPKPTVTCEETNDSAIGWYTDLQRRLYQQQD